MAEPSTYEDLKAQGLLLKFTPKGADALPAEMKDPEGYYYAGRVINMIIAYNASLANPPKGWRELLEAAGKGQLGFPSPLRSGAAQASVQTLADAFGWGYFKEFKRVGGVQVKNNSTMRDEISRGEIKAGALLDYMARAAEAKGSPIKHVWPAEGAVVIPSPIAIFKGSGNAAAAQVFVEYIISKKGQETMVRLGNFIPVRPDVASPKGAPAYGDIKGLPTDWKALSQNRARIIKRWKRVFSGK